MTDPSQRSRANVPPAVPEHDATHDEAASKSDVRLAAAEVESFCRRVSEPTMFALTRLIEGRCRLEAAGALAGHAEGQMLTLLEVARSAIEHAARLIAELYAGLRAGNSPDGVELADIVDSVVELLEPAFEGRARLQRDYRPAPPVPASRVVLARVVTTFLLDALNDVYRRHTGLHDVRIAVGHYEADDVFVDLVRAGPDDPRAALRFSGCSGADPDPWEPVAHAQEGEISVERAFNGRAARIRVRCPASTPGPPRSERPTRRPPFRSG